MKKYLLLLVVALLSPVFISCDKDEPNEDIILNSKPLGREEKQALLQDNVQNCESYIFSA